MKTWSIRPAEPEDLPALESLERECFVLARRCSLRGLRRSLHAPNQRILVIDARAAKAADDVAGAMTLRFYPKTVRIFSLAVRPRFRRAGLGRLLVRAALTEARRSGRMRVTLEADLAHRPLVGWYEAQGFRPARILRDYYAPGEHAVRMRLELEGGAGHGRQ